MQVSIEKVSSVERRLTIVVPASQVEEEYANQITQLARKANIKGFRPGKAPINFIKDRFGADARKEALSELIQSSLRQALSDEKLRPVNTPRVEPKNVVVNQPLEFVVSFEVLPEIEEVNFSLDKIEKPQVDITDEDVGRVIDQLCKQFTKWTLVERPAQDKDRVVVDYYTIFEGKAEEDQKVQNFPVELGSKAMVPGFEEGLTGVKVNETRTLSLTLPDEFSPSERAGKSVDFVVTVKQVFEAEMPAIDETFIQKLGVASGGEDDLKSQIKQTLEQERDRLVKEKIKEQIFKNLLEQNSLEIPPSLVTSEAKNIHNEIYPHHKHDHNHTHSDEEVATFRDVAKKRVAVGLLIAEYAKKTDMQADKARVNKRIQEIASVYEHPVEVITYLSSDERRGGIEAQILEDQVAEKLMESITITHKVLTYAELKGIRI